MFDTSTAPEFAEGMLDLGALTWFCTEHESTVRMGQACAFCKYEELTPAEFDAWALSQ